MKYPIYAGGDRRNQPWESGLNSGNTAPNVRLAAHLKVRTHTIEFHLDFAGEEMRNWMRNLGITKLAFATLDELSTHLLPAGGLIEEIVVQVRRPVVGTAKLVLSGAAGVAPLPLAGTQTVDAATDATALTTGTSGTETDLAPAYTVDLSKEGWYRFSPNVMLQDEGDLAFRPDQDIAAGCFSIFVTVTDYASEHKCECTLPPCNTVYGPVVNC